jgi:Xaa-Pro aminopeptidase
VWGRGGGPIDGCADLLYLTDHYTAFPTIPDVDGVWSGRGFGAAIIAPDASVTVVSDVAEVTEADVYCDRLITTGDVIGASIAALRQVDLAAGFAGLVGGDVLTHAQSARFATELPELRFQPADDIVRRLRRVKSAAEQQRIREACAVGKAAVDEMVAAVRPGATEAEVVAAGLSRSIAGGAALYNAFAETFGPTWRDRGRHRMPTWSTKELRKGDVFSVDLSGALSGYLFDCSRSRAVGEPDADHRLIDLTREAVHIVIQGLRPGRTVADAVRPGMKALEDWGFDLTASDFSAFGHGLGIGWEDPWLLPDNETVIETGMYLAVERFLWSGEDGASYEDDVLITNDGSDVLTVG